jgi:hypothetical protein
MRERAIAAIRKREALHSPDQLWAEYVHTCFKMFLRRLHKSGKLHPALRNRIDD